MVSSIVRFCVFGVSLHRFQEKKMRSYLPVSNAKQLLGFALLVLAILYIARMVPVGFVQEVAGAPGVRTK